MDIIAEAIAKNIYPLFPRIGLIIPVPPSKIRTKQPVYEIAKTLAERVGLQVFEDILFRSPTTKQLKDLSTKAEKISVLSESIRIRDMIDGEGSWNALVIDDLYDTGASLEAVTSALKTYTKIRNVYVATVTWK